MTKLIKPTIVTTASTDKDVNNYYYDNIVRNSTVANNRIKYRNIQKEINKQIEKNIILEYKNSIVFDKFVKRLNEIKNEINKCSENGKFQYIYKDYIGRCPNINSFGYLEGTYRYYFSYDTHNLFNITSLTNDIHSIIGKEFDIEIWTNYSYLCIKISWYQKKIKRQTESCLIL